MDTYVVVDGNSLTYRAFFAVPDTMATASGQVTNAVYGFTSMLIDLIDAQQPAGIVVAFDRPEPTFRHDAEPSYKAQRESAPDILRQQLGLVKDVLTALGIQHVDAAGWEADDLIATIADRLVARGDDVIIVTGDRDSYQLVRDPHVKVMYNKRGVKDYDLFDEAGIVAKTGVTPALYPSYAALRGDPSDNLPGVPGVGEKTAAKLLNKYGDLDGIFAHVDDQTPKLRENLIAHEDRARKNVELMVLRTDAPVDSVDLDDLAITPNWSEQERVFEVLEFRTLGRRLRAALGASAAPEVVDERRQLVPVITSVSSSADALEAITGHEVLDLSSVWEDEPGRSPLVGVAIVTDPDRSEVTWIDRSLMADPEVLEALAAHRSVRGHRVKALMRSLLALGGDLCGLRLDLALAAYLIDPSSSRYELVDLVTDHSSYEVLTDDPASHGQLDLGGESLSPAERAGWNALAIHHLAQPLSEALEASGMADLYHRIENPLVRVLARMEHVGVGVDRDTLTEINERLTTEVEALTAELRTVAGRDDLNVNSPIQLRALLFDEKKISTRGIKKTKTGYSTDARTLAKLVDRWPEFIVPLVRYRELEKLRGTYGQGLIHEVGPDSRIHATFNQTVARTGRLSSDQPNLHNIPVRSEDGRVFRTAFVPTAGRRFLVADYNQIELRCIAHLSADPGLVEAFSTGQDIHNATAARVFGVEPSEVTLAQRSQAKMVSYGLAYGMEAYGLGERLGIPTDEAAVILNAYFDAFPSVKAYMDDTVAEARDKGYTETLFGRRRPIPELINSNWRIRQAGERQAMNAGIQGLAADIFKVALVDIDAALEQGGYESTLVLQVHDEVIVEVPDHEHKVVGELVIDLMKSAADLDVPLDVNVSWGDTWGDAKG